MTPKRSLVNSIPPLLVGGAAAAGMETALGLLLYVRTGLVAALTLVLCVQTGALAFGLWMAPRDSAPPWAGVRRAWILLVLAYVAGAVVAGSWEVFGGLASSWTTRGLGLAFLTALPLYATGLVLGAPALSEGTAGTGLAAVSGATVGFAAIGLAGASLDLAASAYVACMMSVAGAALVHNNILEASARARRDGAEPGTVREDGLNNSEGSDPGTAHGLPPGAPPAHVPNSDALA